MDDQAKTKQQLIDELTELRRRVSEIEAGCPVSNIDDTNRAVEALRKSEERLELALKGADLGMWDYNIQTGEAFINARRAEMTGYSLEEATPSLTWWGSQVHPEDLQRVRKAFNAHVKGRTSLYEVEHRLRHKSGDYIWVLARAKVMEWDKQGNPVRIVGTSLDITDRKRNEEALRQAHEELERRVEERTAELKESEEKYRLIFERSPIGIFHFDEAGSITACNDNFVRIIGSSQEKLIGLNTIRDVRDKKIVAAIQEALSGGMGHYEDYYSSVTAAKTTPVKCEFAPILSHDGRVAGGIGIIEDITERKQAEESLRQSQQVLSLALEGANLGTWDWDLTTGKAAWSERIYSMLGYTPNEFEPNLKNWKRLVHPDDWPRVSETLNLHLEGKQTNFEAIYRTPDKFGNWHWFQVQGTVTEFDADRKPIRMTGVVADITDRKKAEEALQDSEERYRALYEDNPSMYFTMDAQGTVLSVNGFGASELGYRVEELVGQPVLMVFHEDDREAVRQQFAACLQNPMQVAHWEFRKVRKDGSILWVKEVARSIRGADGNPMVLVVCEDITDRKEAEESLRAERERLHMLSDRAPFGMVMIAKDGTFEYANPKFTEMFGYDLNEVPNGREWFRKAYPDDAYRHETIAAWKEDLEGFTPGGTRSRVFEVTCKDGSRKTIHFRPVKLDTGEDLMTCEDITDRILAEEALRQSEKKYKILVEESFDGIFVQKWTKIVFTNSRLREMLGYEEGELEGQDHWLVYHHEYREITCQRAEARLRGEAAPPRYEVRIQRKDGSSFEAEINARAVEVAGEPGIQVWIRDISERKQAENALRESEERFRAAFQTSPDPISISHLSDGVYVEVNDGFSELSGFTREEVIGKSSLEINIWHDPGDRDRLGTQLNERGYVTNFEAQFRLKDGRVRTGLMSARIMVLGGRPYILTITRDVEDWKKAEQALRESEEKYRTLFEESKDAVYITTRDGKLVDANQAFLDLFGFGREEARNMGILQIYADAADRKRFQEEIERKGSLKDYEVSFRKRDGTKIEGLLTSTVRQDKDGKVLGYQGILRDVTERKQLQKQLLQAQKMEAIGTLAGGIAHDFNNLLQAILGYTDILLMQKERGDPDHHKLEIVSQAARDGADLVSRILTFSMKAEFKARPTDLNQEIRRVEKLLRRTVPRMIKIDLVLADDLWVIDADPAQIEQVLLNLAVNAQHAMPDGGRLLIETSNVQLKDDYVRNHLEAKPGKYVLLTVSDTGMGMRPEVVDRIFEPFFTTKASGEGTGLGLAMVHGIVSQHGGYIRCYSEPGLGTSF
ncbi:MAG: PAS domain S-box protein, partial [Desulfomonilaceae bacterium]